jgi:light-dependent protochlorophyllide reductase
MSVCPQRYAVVTGANRPSIGFLTAQRLSAPPHNFRVVLACRDEARGKEAVAEIIAVNPTASVCYLHLDLASLASVRSFVQAFTDLDDKPDKALSVLMNNAGIGFGQDKTRYETADGFELILGVNHLGHFLLTNLLLPSLKRAVEPPARIVVVSSSLHDPGRPGMAREGPPPDVDFDDLHMETADPFRPEYAYCVSKLCNVMFAYELQRRLRLEGSKIAVNTLNPGFIPSSGLIRGASGCATFMLRYVLDGVCACCTRVTRSVEDGATCEVRCAIDPSAQEGGAYFELTREGQFEAIRSSEVSYDEAKQAKLWEISAKLTGLRV